MFIPEIRNNVDRVWQELDEPEYNHFFVKKVVTRALDKHNHEREMASILLFALLGEVCFPLTKAAVQPFCSACCLDFKTSPAHHWCPCQ